MIILNCDQRSEEWQSARLGIPTASEFDKILTPATGKLSTQAGAYRHRLLAEWLTGRAADSYNGGWIPRGVEMEAEARTYYEMLTDRTVEQVGFIFKDKRRLVGCSPDGLFDDTGMEIKCPAPGTHVRYLLDNSLPVDYILQVQGAMWITGAKQWEWLSYHPDMPPVLITVKRDEQKIDLLETAVEHFLFELLAQRQALLDRGLKPINTLEALEASLKMVGA